MAPMVGIGPRDRKRGDKALNAPCRPLPSPTTLQRLLQIQDKERRQPGSGGWNQLEALRAFLDPQEGGYSWQEAYADVGHLVGMLGHVMEVRGLPLGELLSGEPACPVRVLMEEHALH